LFPVLPVDRERARDRAVAGRVKGDARDFAQQQGNEKETGV
jgi:hypothetical protein